MSVWTDILRAIFPASIFGGPTTSVDVRAQLAAMPNPEHLDWQHSIVDLMKLLGLDSSMTNRIQLARELGYAGALNGSAQMNMWLHAEVMRKLQENGGKVPSDLH